MTIATTDINRIIVEALELWPLTPADRAAIATAIRTAESNSTRRASAWKKARLVRLGNLTLEQRTGVLATLPTSVQILTALAPYAPRSMVAIARAKDSRLGTAIPPSPEPTWLAKLLAKLKGEG